MTTFKERHPELQQLVRELHLLRAHNLLYKPGDPQDKLLLFAEASLTLLVLERFVRIVLGADAADNDTVYNLLQKAVSRKLLTVPWDDQEEGIRKIKSVRSTLLHGNYEQAATLAGCASVADYFKTQFAAEVEAMYQIADHLARAGSGKDGRSHSGNLAGRSRGLRPASRQASRRAFEASPGGRSRGCSAWESGMQFKYLGTLG